MSDFPGVPLVTPYLTVSHARAAIALCHRAFDARETDRVEAEDGRTVLLSDGFPGFNQGQCKAPGPDGPTGATIRLNVADVDAVMTLAVAAGATTLMQPRICFGANGSGSRAICSVRNGYFWMGPRRAGEGRETHSRPSVFTAHRCGEGPLPGPPVSRDTQSGTEWLI